jgi:UDP-N-acetyl-D-mannosaminuronic acid transferase (WecB/TagA/CpsF family)
MVNVYGAVAPKPLSKEILESGWHLAVVALFSPPCWRWMTTHRAGRDAALVVMVGGAIWHEYGAVRTRLRHG